MNSIKIPSGTEVTLKSKYNQKYFGYKYQSYAFAAQFPPPSVNTNIKNLGKVDRALKFEIVPQYGQSNGFVTEGSRVLLIHHPLPEEDQQKNPDSYLTCTAKNEIKFDKKTSNEQSNKMLLKSAIWTISFSSFQKELIPPSRSELKIYDNVVLKSIYGSYLTVNSTTLACNTTIEMDEDRSVWNIQIANSLPLPSWLYEKPSFAKFTKAESSEILSFSKRNLASHSPEIQQMLLVQDLLDIMLGFEGTYIKKRPGTPFYVIEPHLSSPSCSPAIAQNAYKIIELPSHYERLMRFMKDQQYKESILSQALCDGLKEMIYQYYHQVTQLDQKQSQTGITLQNMLVEIQDSIKVMRALGDLTTAASNMKGGQLITCLLRLINDTTDRHVLFIYKHLYQKLMKLYIAMLSRWIYEGKIEDRHCEFMIYIDQKSVQWTNWEQKFLLKNQMIPSILERDAQTILVTGKYINILKACNRQIKCPFAKEIENNIEHHANKLNFTEPIQKAYEWANEQLLQLVFTQYKFQEVISSLKGYFFLSYGDLFLHFLDAAEEDLIIPKKAKNDGRKQFSLQKLQNLFELNVRTSSASNDAYKDDISLKLQGSTLFQQIHRIKTLQSETFAFNFSQKPFLKKDARYVDYINLDFKCLFPLNLILNKRAISKYQCLFRYMFWFKFLQRQLNFCWVKLQNTNQSNVECFKIAYITNNKIIHFIKSFIYYLSEEVIQQNWIKLTTDLKKAKNLEEIIQFHQKFLNSCLKESLLTNQILLQILASEIGNTIHSYFKIKEYLSEIEEELNTFKETKPTLINQRRQYLKIIQEQVSDLVEEKKFIEFITAFKNTFDDLIRKFIREVSQSTAKEENHLLRLSEMLDQENHMNRKEYYR